MTAKAESVPGNGFAASESLRQFRTPHEMVLSLDAFVAFLEQTYGFSSPRRVERRGLFGFFVRRLLVKRDRSIDEVEVRSDFGQATAIILVPWIQGERDADWRLRRDAYLSLFVPTLQAAQVRAMIELYRALSDEAKRGLVRDYRPRRRGTR